MAEAIVSIVVGRLTDLLSEEAQVLNGVRDEIQQLVSELMRMKTFLRDADSRLDEEKISSLLADVRDLAYDAEHGVEIFLVKALSSGKTIQWINKIKFPSKIKDIQRRMSLLFNLFRDYNVKSTLQSPEFSSSSSGTTKELKRFHTFTTVEPEIFVGLQADVDRLVGHLVDESDDSYPLISICGMGGLGKTTLAEKIYNHTAIKKYFAGLAWVSISQKWQPKLVLQRILIGLVHEKKEEIFTWDDDKLVENLQQIQQKKKCLIVLDDIWTTDAWDSIKKAFATEKSLSKLMLTSRNVDVAKHVNPKGLIHQPQCLDPEQSWKLLKFKAFPKGGDALDITRDVIRMEELGRELVKNCAGLPLAIVMLGGILVTKPSLIEWEKVHDDAKSSLERGKGLGENYQSQLLGVLVWSYNDLPPQLKPCFLYLGKFNEDEWMEVETLYQLWIAEGMVLSSDRTKEETMMQVAESYLGELVHKSMVQVKYNDVESSLTKFKSCSLHDLMRELSLNQAKKEDLYKVVDLREGDNHLQASVDMRSADMTRQLVVCFGERHTGKQANHYFGKKSNQQRYRSVLLFNEFKWRSLPPRLGLYLANFKLLRVLDLENLKLSRQSVLGALLGTNIGRVLGSLVYLRYLSLRGSNLKKFPWIQKLVLLQTLKLDKTDLGIPPVSGNVLGKLAHLRHLYLPEIDILYTSSRNNYKLQFNGLSKLETLENFDTRWCEVKDLPKLSSLRRLKLRADGNYDEVEEMFNHLKLLSSNSCLQYLALDIRISVSDRGLVNNPNMIKELLWNHKFNLQELTIWGQLPELSVLFVQQQQLNHTHFDVSLIRITTLKLWCSCLEEDMMPALEKIPTLRDLDLYESYKGKEMVCSAMGFPSLTRLQMWNLPNLEKWRVEEGSMPILQYLRIHSCKKLEELPEGLIFLNSLRELLLAFMPSKFRDRLRSENGEQGPDFYKVAHIPDMRFYP